MPGRMLTVWVVALTMGATSCGGAEPATPEESIVTAPETIGLTSTAFEGGQPIPAQYTCDGKGESPPLAWDRVPGGTAALALVVDDPDAPRGTFVHWAVLDIAVATEAVDAGAVPSGGVQARNTAGRAGYYAPCPPSGTHHYRFTLYALSKRTGLRDGAALDQALAAIRSAATAQGRLVGTYTRSG